MTQFVRAIFFGVLLTLSFASPLLAVTYTWDTLPGTNTTGDSIITGGTGTWNTTLRNWTTNGGTSTAAWVNGATNDAVFGGETGFVFLNSTITANALTFNSDGYVLNGSTLTLAGTDPTLSVTQPGHIVTINNALSGSAGMHITGGGTVRQLGSTSSLTGTYTVDSSATLLLMPSGNITNAFGGAGTVILQGINNPNNALSSAHLLFNNNPTTYSGSIIVRNLVLSTSTTNLGATEIETSGYSYISAGITTSTNITLNSWGIVDSNNGDLGSLRLTGATLNGTITLARDSRVSSLTVGSTIGGTVQESGGARRLEIGVTTGEFHHLTLKGTTTHTGGTLVNGFGGLTTLVLDYSNSNSSKFLDSSKLIFQNDTTLTLGGTAGSHTEVVGEFINRGFLTINRSGTNTARIALGNMNNAGIIDVSATGLVTTTSSNNSLGYLPGVLFNNFSTSQLAANDGAGNIVAAPVAYTTISVTNTTTRTIVSQAGSLVRLISGGGTSGILNVSASTTEIGSLFHDATPDTLIDLGGNRTLRFAADGEIIGNRSSELLIANGFITAGGTNNSPGALSIRGGEEITTIQAVIRNNGTGAVSVALGGNVNLGNANTFSGNLTISGRTAIAGNDSLGTGTAATLDGGTLLVNLSRFTRNLVVTSNGGELITANINTAVEGTISGPGKMTFSGSPTSSAFHIERQQNYTGGTLILGTEVRVDNIPNALGPGPITIRSGTTNGANLTITGGVWTNDFFLSGQTTGSEGALRLGNATLQGTITLDGEAGIATQSPGATIQGAITGPFGFAKLGINQLTLTGDNTYTGGTTVAIGTLAISGSGSLTGGDYHEPIILSTSSTTLLYESSTDQILRGSISGGGDLIKAGSSTLTIIGTNTLHTGDFTVNAGKLLVNGPNNASVVVNAGVLGGTGAVGSVTVANGGTLAPGASIESFAAGNVTLQSGATFEYELNTATLAGDLLKANFNVTINGAQLDVTDLASSPLALPLGSKLTLINYGGTLTGTFANLLNGQSFALGSNYWRINYADSIDGSNFASEQTFNRSVTLTTVVPEPSTAVLGGLAFVSLVWQKYRRRTVVC